MPVDAGLVWTAVDGEDVRGTNDLRPENRLTIRAPKRRKQVGVDKSDANFILGRLRPTARAAGLKTALLTRGNMIRDCGILTGQGPDHFRVEVRERKFKRQLIQELGLFLQSLRTNIFSRRETLNDGAHNQDSRVASEFCNDAAQKFSITPDGCSFRREPQLGPLPDNGRKAKGRWSLRSSKPWRCTS